jgi:hypothetical protein
MTRNIKILGLALVAMLVLGSAMASEASALKPHLTVESYPAVLSGQLSEGVNEFRMEGGRVSKCENVKYAGSYTKAEAEAGSGLVGTPEFINCTTTILGNVTPTTITMNGCRFGFTVDTYVSETEATGNQLRIECPEGKKIESHAWATNAKHLANEAPLCTWALAPQTAEATITYQVSGPAETPHTYLIARSTNTFAVTKTSGTVTNCGAASQTGESIGAVKMELRNEKGELEHPTWKNE